MCGFGIAPGPSQAQTQAVGSAGPQATLRLVATAGPKGGKYDAGIGLTLSPGAHTYWKMPGEAGVPPVFAFNGSENVKQAEVLYPAPQRITEGDIDAFGYTGQVVFPVAVSPIDPTKPSTLRVDVSYAVCSRICVPGHGQGELRLTPGGPGTSPTLVTAALAQVPKALTNPNDLQIVPEAKATEPTWILTWKGGTPVSDVFADAPDGFYFSTKKLTSATWALTASRSVATSQPTKVPVGLVLAEADGARQVIRSFDLPPLAK